MRKILKIVFVFNLWFIWFGFHFVYSDTIPCSSLFVQGINDDWDISYKNSPINTTNIIKNFCQKVSDFSCVNSNGNDDYFSANQSIFLSILCNSVGPGYPGLDGYSHTLQILNKTGFSDFGIITSDDSYIDDCNYRNGMNDCILAETKVLPSIFNGIMNDLFNIRQARSYGINSLNDNIPIDNFANNFSKENFPGLKIGICDPNNKYYKNTCSKLKSYMTKANNLLQHTKIINLKKMQEIYSDADCENEKYANILYCGLLGDENTIQYSFVNAVYNEYFWYKLFFGYYAKYVDIYKFGGGDESIELIDYQVGKSKYSITTTLRFLSDFSYSFPLHIGLLMYKEDIQVFMEEISSIYSPIRTLYDKLQNVQDAKS